MTTTIDPRDREQTRAAAKRKAASLRSLFESDLRFSPELGVTVPRKVHDEIVWLGVNASGFYQAYIARMKRWGDNVAAGR